jgi:hypothetical protein
VLVYDSYCPRLFVEFVAADDHFHNSFRSAFQPIATLRLVVWQPVLETSLVFPQPWQALFARELVAVSALWWAFPLRSKWM